MIKRSFFCRMRYLLWHSDLEATRFTLGLSALLWGILLGWPGDLFPEMWEIEQGRGRMTYAIMATIMPEDAWAVLWLMQGSVMLFSLFTGVRNCALIVVDAVLGVFLWTVCVISSFVVYWPEMAFSAAIVQYKPPAAMAGEVGMVLASWWVLIRYKCGMESHDRKNCQ